jgi:hypothetical protein
MQGVLESIMVDATIAKVYRMNVLFKLAVAPVLPAKCACFNTGRENLDPDVRMPPSLS